MSRSTAIYHQQRARQHISQLLQTCRLGNDVVESTPCERERAYRMARNHLVASRSLRTS